MKRLGVKLVLEERILSGDGAGGFSGDWAALGVHWGAVEPATGRLGKGEEFARTTARYKITVRAAPVQSSARPKAGQRFRAGARVFDIRAVLDNGDARYLICYAEEEVAA